MTIFVDTYGAMTKTTPAGAVVALGVAAFGNRLRAGDRRYALVGGGAP